MSSRLPTESDEQTLDPLEEHRSLLRADLKREMQRVTRKVRNIETDLLAAVERDELRAQAELIVANLYRLKELTAGTTFELLDYREDPPIPVRITLQPRQSAQQKSEELFRRAKKLERTEQVATERLGKSQARRAQLEQAQEAVETATTIRALERIRTSMRIAQRQAAPAERQRINEERPPFRSFRSGRFEVRVGRGAKDNDALTLHNSKPYDLWLHVRGTPGSHVILRLRRGQVPPPEALLDAATLAVHFSNARQKHAAYKSPVEVQYTERRFVRKVRHAPPGQVLVQREKVILLEVQPQRLKRLLESET